MAINSAFKLANLFPGLAELDGNFVLKVGVLDDATNIETGEYVADYAEKQEYGAPGAGIPARPAIRSAFDGGMDEYVKILADYLSNGASPELTLDIVGEKMAKDITQSIVDWKSPPNSQETEMQKGFNDPLIHTKAYVKSITHHWDKE